MRVPGRSTTRSAASVQLLIGVLRLRHSTNNAFVVPSSPFSVSNHRHRQVEDRTAGPIATDSNADLLFESKGNRYRRSALHAPSLSSSSSSTTETRPQSVHDDECDVLILGSGPAARAIATLLSSTDLDVLLADSNYDREWSPNYGLWRDEWDAISARYSRDFDRAPGGDCIDRQWDVTDTYFGGSFDIPTEQRLRVDRPYVRIDKGRLRAALSPTDDRSGAAEGSYRVVRANHASQATSLNIYAPSGSLVHDAEGSTIQLSTAKDSTPLSVRAKIIVDCTGHETKLVLPDDRSPTPPPGYQIAYGALVTVDESASPDTTHVGPYDKDAMTLFDYRTDHFPPGSAPLLRATESPTFMYAMPLGSNRIFFEETSLVARPAISFAECKERCFTRLEHLGITVASVEEEEFCYIPMGGPLPARDQRVLGFGGAAAMVHPSTGFSLARVLMGAADVSRAVAKGIAAGAPPDRVAADGYGALWTPEDVAQRNFAVFGGEFLMEMEVEGLRGFFDGFFRIDAERWGGFLAGRPGLPGNKRHDSWWERMVFGLVFISRLRPPVAGAMLWAIVRSCVGGVELTQSVTPLFGNPAGYGFVERPEVRGDLAAKDEARRMIEESRVEEEMPTAFR